MAGCFLAETGPQRSPGGVAPRAPGLREAPSSLAASDDGITAGGAALQVGPVGVRCGAEATAPKRFSRLGIALLLCDG